MNSKQHRWLDGVGPCVAFMVLPTIILVVAYFFPASNAICITAGVIVLSLLLVFLWSLRRNELTAIAAIIPNVVGPFLTELFVEHQTWPTPATVASPNLQAILDSGGDLLMQMAFFFTSLVVMAVYLGQRFLRGKVPKKDVISYIVFVVIIFAMATMSKDFFMTSYLPGHGFLPNITCFFVARFLIVLNAIALATWPPDPSQSES